MSDATAPDSPGRRRILAAIETAPDRVTGSGALAGVVYSQSLWACPVQIVGMADGVPFYFRYRWGWLHVGFGGDPIQDAEWTFGQTIGDRLDGSMTSVETEEWLATAVAAWRGARGMAEHDEPGFDIPAGNVWLTGGRQATCASKVYLRREHGEVQYGRRLGDIAVWWRGVRYDIEPGPARIGTFSRAGQQN